MGLPYLNAYLDAVGSNFSHGANFATAGSTIRPQNTTLHQSGFSPFSFNVQWYQFHDFHHRSQIFRTKGMYLLCNYLYIYIYDLVPVLHVHLFNKLINSNIILKGFSRSYCPRRNISLVLYIRLISVRTIWRQVTSLTCLPMKLKHMFLTSWISLKPSWRWSSLN